MKMEKMSLRIIKDRMDECKRKQNKGMLKKKKALSLRTKG